MFWFKNPKIKWHPGDYEKWFFRNAKLLKEHKLAQKQKLMSKNVAYDIAAAYIAGKHAEEVYKKNPEMFHQTLMSALQNPEDNPYNIVAHGHFLRMAKELDKGKVRKYLEEAKQKIFDAHPSFHDEVFGNMSDKDFDYLIHRVHSHLKNLTLFSVKKALAEKNAERLAQMYSEASEALGPHVYKIFDRKGKYFRFERKFRE